MKMGAWKHLANFLISKMLIHGQMGMGFILNYLEHYWRMWEKQGFPLVDLEGEASSTYQKGNPSHGACEGRGLRGMHVRERRGSKAHPCKEI